MPEPARRSPSSRRLFAVISALLVALEPGVLPAAAKTTAAAAASVSPARRAAPSDAPLPDLLATGVLAGRLRAAGRALVAEAPADVRAEVARWVALTLEDALDGLGDGAAVPDPVLARLRAALPGLRRAETRTLPASASPAAVAAAQAAAERRIARLGLPDFAVRAAEAVPAVPGGAAAGSRGAAESARALPERLGQKGELAGPLPASAELDAFERVAGRAERELGPAAPAASLAADDASDAGWASLDALGRLFGRAGEAPQAPSPSGPPPPREQLSRIEDRLNAVEALKLRLNADLAQRDAAESLLAVKARLRDDALAARRGGKDDLEFRKNFSRLAMVMDLSYSLNILNSADAALAKMQGLLDKKIEAIAAQRQANDSAAAAAAAQAANTDQWKKDAQRQAADDRTQAGDFASLGGNVGKVGDAVAGFRADVPALLAMIDARDKGRGANALAEYDRRLALLPGMAEALKSGSSNPSSGVGSLSLSYLQAKSREVAGDRTLLAGADAKITSVPVEFAGALVVAVPGVPSETMANPTRDQVLALLARRRAFWQSQLDEHQALLDSIQRAMDPANRAMTTDDFGAPQPESLVVWRANERALDDQLAAAEAPMTARADADEAVIEAAGSGASLPRLSGLTPEDMRSALPRLLDAMDAVPLPDTDAGFAAKAAHIDLARLIAFLGDATARRLEARAVVAALDKPIGVILPKAHDAFQTAVAAWKAVLADVAADEAYEKAGGPASQAPALIARKRALLSGALGPALSALQDLLDQTLIPYQADRIAQSDPANTGDGYATLYTQKKKLYQDISDGLRLTLPWALASNGAKAYDAGAARAGIASVRATYDKYRGVVADYQDQMRRRQDPNENGMESVYGENAPYSLVKRISVYQAEKTARAAALNADAVQINDLLGKMDALDGGKHALLASWRLPTDLDPASPASADRLTAMVNGNVLQNMAAAIKSVADAASAAGGAPSVSVGGGAGIPVGVQPPLDVTPMQKLALYGLEAVKRLVPSSASGPAGDSYAQSLARFLFADALVSSSKTYLTDRIPLFVSYLARAKAALDGASADLDADLAWVSGDRAGGDAVLTRKAALFASLAGVLRDGAALFEQKAGWSASGADTAIQAASYYNGLNQTFTSGNQALDAELSAARQFQSALADSKSKIDSQRSEVVGWLGQLNSPNESALNRVAQNISAIQDKTRAVLETNVAARQAERERDAASASVEATLRALAAERSALDRSLAGVGDLARLGPDLAARTREAVGGGGAWIAESPSASTLVIPRGQLETFLGQLFSGLSADAAAANIAALRADILKDPSALARLLPGSKVIPVGQGPDGFYLVYQTEFSTPGGLETANSATLGNIAKLWGQNVSLIGYRFASPPSAGNAPFGDQGVTVQVESLDSDHAVNYLDVTFHKFLQDVPTDLGVAGQAQEARMMVFDDFALLLNDGKVYFGAAGFADMAASGGAEKPSYYGGNLKTSVKFTQVLSLNASETALFAKDPRKFLQTVNLDFTKYDPTLDQNFIISGQGENKSYRRDQIGVGVDLKEALKQKDSFMLDFYYARVAGTDDVNQSLVGATVLKGFTFDFLGQKSKVTIGAGGELGEKQNDFNGRLSYELPDQGIALSLQGKYIGTGSAYYAQLSKKMGDHSTAAVSYGSPYIGLNNRAAISFSSSYTLGELWRAVTGQAASDLSGGRALADFDKAAADFFTRGSKDAALAELKKVFDADVGRQLAALEIGKLSREIETLTRAGALLDNTRQSAMVGFVSNPIGPGTAETATGGGFQVGTRTDLTLTKTQRALIESKTATLFSLGLDLQERLLDLTKAWQQALAELAQARWRELLAGWLAAHADDPVLRAEAEADAAAAAGDRRQAELKYDSLTGRGPDDVPSFDGVNPQDFDALLDQVSASLTRSDRVGALLQRIRGSMDIPAAGLNVLDWVPWVEKLSFTVGAQLPDVLSSQPLGIGLTITLPVYDPGRGRRDAAMLLQERATMLEMAGRLSRARLRAHGEALSARAWAERAAAAASQETRLAAELSDGIRQSRNGLIEASELRGRARRWREAVAETLSARVNASLQAAWASLDESGSHGRGPAETTAVPADMKAAYEMAAHNAPSWEALALRSQAASELLAASDRRVRKVTADVNLGSNLTATGLALLPAFGITGLAAMPIVGVQLAPEELRQLDAARTGAEAGLYARLKDKAAADAAQSLTQATIDGAWLDRQLALYRDELLPGLEAARDGSSARELELSEARAAYADLQARRRQSAAAANQLLGRPLDAPLPFAPDPETALASFEGRSAALDPVAAARDALQSRVKIARAVEAAVDKNLKVEQLRLEPISLIGASLGRLVAALSGDAAGSPELMALARERTLDAERALEAFDASVPAVRARLAVQLSAAAAARAALAGLKDPASRLRDLELGRTEDLLKLQLAAWGAGFSTGSDGALPSSYAELEDRLKRAAEGATFPSEASADSGALSAPGAVELQGSLRWYDARQTLAGDPIGRQFVEGWVEARLRSPLTPPEALAMLAGLREKSADERRRLDVAGADARAELLLARLRLGAGLLRWSEGVGLGESARARAAGDLAEAAALLRLPASVKPERLLELMPAEADGGLAAIARRSLDEAEALDLEALSRTLFLDGLPRELSGESGRDRVPELRADLIAERMSSRGFTPVAAFGLFRGQWVSGAFLEAPNPEQIQQSLTSIVDDALRSELESRDRLKSLGLLLHALMSSVAGKTRLVAAARLRETLARRALAGTLERVRLRMTPVSEAAAAADEAQAAQEAFVTALFSLREDFARLTTELTALGVRPGPSGGAVRTPDDDGEPRERTAREKLLAYWADRMKDPDFERRAEALLAGQPPEALASLRDLSERYRRAERDAEAVRAQDFSPAERLELLTKTDVQGRRRAIEEILAKVLTGLQDGDPAHSPAWASLMGFLRADVTARASDAAAGVEREAGTRAALREVFASALADAPERRAELAALETLQTRADQARREALASWLAREGGAEDHVLKDRALDAYVSALDAFDAELQRALSAKGAAADAGWTRSLDAMYDVRGSLARRRDRLKYGRGLLTIDAAIALGESRLRAVRYADDESRELQPASESLAFLRGLRERWTGHPESIPALVALRGKDGGSEWATVEDVAKAKLEGRVAAFGGRRFVRPSDAPDAAPADAADALSRGWREVLEGEDAARERLDRARERRSAAAREAAMTETLRGSEVAVAAGPAGSGAVRTATLAELRALESAGRALWFEASADPRTGLRAAVPAVAARWRDPAELVLLIAGAAPPAGRYPTLEALLASPEAKGFSRARLGAAGLEALKREAAGDALAARREGWLKLKLSSWGFGLDASGEVAAVYLNEDEWRKASAAAASDPKDPGRGWTFLKTDALVLGLAEDGTLASVRAGARVVTLGDATPSRWVSQAPLALETDAQGRVTRLFLDRRELDRAAAGWSLEDAQGREWKGGDALPPLLRARRWSDPETGRTVALGRDLLAERRDAAKSGQAGAGRWGYMPAQWPALLTEIPRGVISTPVEIATGRDANQQGYLGRVNARRGEGGATVARGAAGSVLRAIDLFGLMNDPVDRYFDPSQYPDAVRRSEPLSPGGSAGGSGMRTTDGKKNVFYGAGSFAREAGWARQDLEASRAEVLAAFRGGVRRETVETLRGRAGDYADSTVGLDVGRGAALSAIDELGARLDAGGEGRVTNSPRRAAVDRVDTVVQIVAGAETQAAREAIYEAALKRLKDAPPPDASAAEIADAEASLAAALAARRAGGLALAAARPSPNLPGYPLLPRLYASLAR